MKFHTLADFSFVTGVGIAVFDNHGVERYVTAQSSKSKVARAYLERVFGAEGKAESAILENCRISAHYGGYYVFQCPCGLTYFTSLLGQDLDLDPDGDGEQHWFVLGGPIVLGTLEDYIEFEVLERCQGFGPNANKLAELLTAIPQASSSYVSALSRQVFALAQFIGGNKLENNNPSYCESIMVEAKAQVAEILPPGNSSLAKDWEQHMVPQYLFDDPQAAVELSRLLENLADEEQASAKVLRNELLTHAVFSSRKNMEYIKNCFMDYVRSLYESAMYSNSDIKLVTQLRNRAYLGIGEADSLNQLVLCLNHTIDQFSTCLFVNANSKYRDIISATYDYFREHYAERLTLKDVADHVHISPSYLSRLINSETGRGFWDSLNIIRVNESKVLMNDAALNITEIGYQVGFEDQSHFSKVFKRFVGLTPQQYRKRTLSVA